LEDRVHLRVVSGAGRTAGPGNAAPVRHPDRAVRRRCRARGRPPSSSFGQLSPAHPGPIREVVAGAEQRRRWGASPDIARPAGKTGVPRPPPALPPPAALAEAGGTPQESASGPGDPSRACALSLPAPAVSGTQSSLADPPSAGGRPDLLPALPQLCQPRQSVEPFNMIEREAR
jgi:hypothetical protein